MVKDTTERQDNKQRQEQDEFELEEEQNETNEYDRFVLEEVELREEKGADTCDSGKGCGCFKSHRCEKQKMRTCVSNGKRRMNGKRMKARKSG